MKIQIYKPTHLLGAFILLFAVSMLFFSCKKDELNLNPLANTLIASFQYQVSAANFLEVSFSNYSQNASSYEWDFGDGNTSTEKSPTYAYAQAGTYTVSLKSSNNAGENKTRTETITLTDPDQTLALLAGSTSKTWYLQREGIALGIGPTAGDSQWWSFGGVTPLGDRPCILDDQYIFHRDGKFEFNSNNTLFIDGAGDGGWFAPTVAASCHNETEPGVFTSVNNDDLSAFKNGGDYTYAFNQTNNTLTLNGLGAYIGLPNKTADGDNYIPISTKTYKVVKFVAGPIADTLRVSLVGNGFAWNFNLVSYNNPADLPALPGPKPSAAFEFTRDNYTVTFTNKSINATSYLWDFGDGGTSTVANPVHTYPGDGSYTVTLTAMDGMGQTSTKTADITISAAVFSTATLSGSTGKTWRLAGAGSIKVGPAAGSGEWFTIDDQGALGRPCQMNDEFTFSDDGSFTYDSKGDIFFEDYLGGMNTCADESVLTAPFDVLKSGTHSFTVQDAVGMDPATIKAIGKGAFIGFSKAFNGGELNAGNGTGPADDITYTVFDYSKVGDDETLVLIVDISGTGGAWWTITITTKQ